MIREEYLQKQCSEYEQRRHEMAIEAAYELSHFPYGGDIGGDVQGVGDQQQQHNALKHNRRERRLDVGGESFPGDPADARAHGLNRGHQRIGQRHRPKHVEAELRARLRVGGYAARVVVRHASDKTRPDPRQRVLLQAAPKEPEGVHARRSSDVILRGLHVLHPRLMGNKHRYFRRQENGLSGSAEDEFQPHGVRVAPHHQ
jgi:hypothetical protein